MEDEIGSSIDKDFWFSDNKSIAISTAVQCKGIGRTLLVRCKNKTMNTNGYCELHRDQASDTVVSAEQR